MQMKVRGYWAGGLVLLALPALPALGALAAPPLKTVRVALAVLGDSRGMTAYTFSLDQDGQSRCTDRCATRWPPIAAPEGELPAPYSALVREDGVRQLQYQGKPLYLWAGDVKPGDATGEALEGFGGTWSVFPSTEPSTEPSSEPAAARARPLRADGYDKDRCQTVCHSLGKDRERCCQVCGGVQGTCWINDL
jgi:predicted lipoprotein with Yx(FWY)xxD motif